MKKHLLTFSILCIGLGLSAQIEHGGSPLAIQSKAIQSQVPVYATPAVDMETVRAQDEVTDQYKETMYRFGIDHEVDIDFFEFSSAQIHKGTEIRRMGIRCPEALSVNFLVDDFHLPEGAQVFVYSADGKEVKGAFTYENNRESGIFPVGLIGGEEIVIEYIAPLATTGASFHISQITHGYRSVLGYWDVKKGPFGSSGPCNINVNCPEGLPWVNQKRATVIIVQGGGVCSGSMVNNVNQDETPLFMTANHCLGNPSNWMYYFNHESATCTGSTGPTNQSISGGSLLASGNNADFALIELNSNIPASYEPCFTGYDATDIQNVTSAVGVHHPGGDVKKICFENNAPFHQNVNFNGNPQTRMWYINQWEDGVTEPGSSGSPLFNQDGRVIGVLSGGAAACNGTVNNGLYDFYGRVGEAWDGTSSTSRLKDHLDPGNTNTLITDMYCPYDVIYANDAASQGILDIPELICDLEPFFPTFILRNAGSEALTSATISSTYNGVAQADFNWVGNLAQGETANLTMAEFTPTSGTNTIEISVSQPNGVSDENNANDMTTASITSAEEADNVWTVLIETDDYGYETYWEIRSVDSGVLVAAGGNTDVGPNGGGAQSAGPGDPGAYANNTIYDEEVIIPDNGCYEFLIVDDYGDGICCGFGEGSFSVTDGGGNVILAGGEFSSTESAARSVTATGIVENSLNQVM
ncbi:MAG: trypsin-like peptidase domain-containing protein, partial [Flavobacteriales bacterium]|nr:trypsin-like peptidase domain-containing protein [Flavobacteriales bacterium]